jgi:CheY-like chemotaxis protein
MRQKLLLADDSITVQRVIELTFSDEGLDIVTVGDGAQAIEHLRRDRADIVLADLNMPNVDGYAVAEHVKRTPELVATTRVVLLTGAFEPVDRDRAQKLGVDGILAKPFEPQVAIELVRQLLAQPPLSPPRTVTAVVAAVAVASPSDWSVDVSARSGSTASGSGGTDAGRASAGKLPAGAGAESRPPVAAGYPFEPGAPATARSTPAELDDYFKRLDEALASAGLKASPAVRDMLAESKEPGNAAAEEGAERAKASTAAGGTGARAFGARDAQAGRPVGAEEERLMSGVPPRGPGKVTLVDAFSALLAAEQGDGSAEASLTAWEPAHAASDESESGPGVSEHSASATSETASASGDAVEVEAAESESRAYSVYGSASATDDAGVADASDADEVEIIEEAAAPVAAAAVTPVTAAAVSEPPAPAVSQEQLEAVVRKVLGEMTDRLVAEMRETVSNRVVDVAERLVREEIERLKAAAEADQA